MFNDSFKNSRAAAKTEGEQAEGGKDANRQMEEFSSASLVDLPGTP